MAETTEERRREGAEPVRVQMAELAEEVTTLMQQEIRLFKAELREDADDAKKGSASLAVGGGVAAAGGLTLVAALVLLLSEAMAPWLAALLVGLATSGVGGALLLMARRKLHPDNLKPERTAKSMRRNREFLEEQTS